MDGLSSTTPVKARDALLVKMALEGKDYQTARKEMSDAAGPVPTTDPRPSSREPVPDSAWSMDVVEIQRITVDLETPEAQVHLEATQVTSLSVRGGRPQSTPKDPLLVDLDGDGPETTGRAGAQLFDLEGNGHVAPTSFVSGGDALLALDRDGSGRIDSGLELFGDQHGAADGYAELAKFDDNTDGRIDAQDHVFTDLRLLMANGNLRTLADEGITALDLGARFAGRSLANGDVVYSTATAYTANGQALSTYAMGLQSFEVEA